MEELRGSASSASTLSDEKSVCAIHEFNRNGTRTIAILLKESLVMATASRPLDMIHAVTNLVLKLLYESSKVFFSTTTGSM